MVTRDEFNSHMDRIYKRLDQVRTGCPRYDSGDGRQKEALWPTLLRFHREVIAPEVREIVSTEINKTVGALQNDLNAYFDGIYKRLDRVDSEAADGSVGTKDHGSRRAGTT